MVIVGGFNRVRNADAGRFYGKGEKGAEIGGREGLVVGAVPPRRAGSKAMWMTVFIDVKLSATSNTTRCRYFHSC